MTGAALKSSEATAIASSTEIVVDGVVARSFRVLPFGNPFYGRDGRGPWILRDHAHAEAVLAATAEFHKDTEPMVDYDHQSVLAATAGVGGRAPAAGWIKGFDIRDDGIWVTDAEWTAPALTALEAREYRYVSPYFRFNRQTGEVTRIVNVGLTNSPALELAAIAASHHGDDMDLSAIASALSLPVTASQADILAQITADKQASALASQQLSATAIALGLTADKVEDAAIAAATISRQANSPDPEKFVPKSGYDAVAGELRSLKEASVIASVDAAIEAGKVPPAMKQWALEYASKDAAAFASYVDAVPAFAGDKKVADGKPASSGSPLTDDERAICALTGVSEEDFLKTRNEGKSV